MNFYKDCQRFSRFSIYGYQLEYDACNLVEKFDKYPKAYSVTIKEKIYDPVKIRVLMNILAKQTQIKILELLRNEIDISNGAKYLTDGLRHTNITCLKLYESNLGNMGMKDLADILKDTCITNLDLGGNNIGDDGMKYLASGLKNSNVIILRVANNGIKSHTIKYLADVLKDTNIISIDVSNYCSTGNDYNQIADEGLKYLSQNLKHSNISYLNVESNDISNLGIEYLAEHLKDTCVTSLYISNHKIDTHGFKCLAQALKDTQIIKLYDVDYEYDNDIDPNPNYMLDMNLSDLKIAKKIISQNKIKASKIKDTFKKLVVINSETYDLEFMIPNETKDFVMEEYLYIIKEINENPNVKGHIFDIIKESKCQYYPNIIKKINEFIIKLQHKFISFIDNKLPILVQLLDSHVFVKLVKQFENIKLCEIVQNLLLHRVLYYVDENAEILHPYIYKMLDKYSMPLYNEQLEPNKKEKIISFYQDHQEIAGAQEIIDFLKFKSL